MAERLSTGLRQFLMGEGSMRKAFEDSVLKIYSGAAPTTANDAVTGTLLVTVTKSSGAVSSGERGTPEHSTIQITSHAAAETWIVNVTVDGVGPTSYTYTNTPDAGDVNAVALLVARMLNDIPQLSAVAAGATLSGDDGWILIESRFASLAHTLASGGGTGTMNLVDGSVAAVDTDALSFAAPSAGAMSKASETWSGVVATSGVAGYFRLVTSDDDGTDSSTQVRLQGSVSTSGAELNLSNTSLVAATTLTIDTFSATLPAE